MCFVHSQDKQWLQVLMFSRRRLVRLVFSSLWDHTVFSPEDRSSMHLRNVCIRLQDYKALQPREPQSTQQLLVFPETALTDWSLWWIFMCCILSRPVCKNVYFIFQSTQQFIQSTQMTYLHEGRISKAQYVSTSNGSSPSAELIPNMDPYCWVVLSVDNVTHFTIC
jgi:hypothetical protein